MIGLDDIRQAESRIRDRVARTPTVSSRTLSRLLGAEVYLKLELFQRTGSFKPRGAFNQLLGIPEAARSRGVVGMSGGNFAQGLAFAAAELDLPAVVVMPSFTPQHYLDATRGYGAEVALVPDLASAEEAVNEYVARGWAPTHPFDNADMMAGNGTLALEIIEDVPEVDHLFVSIGGGGLITGLTVGVKALRPSVRVWGVETEGADTMARSLASGEPVRMEPTSAARTLGAPYVAGDAFETALTSVEEVVVVSDADAYRAMRLLMERAKVVPELAASCTLAAAERVRDRFRPGDRVVLLICGGNVAVSEIADFERRFS